MIGLILAAAGTGSRLGAEVPKQFVDFHGKRLYLHSLETFLPFVSEAVVVVPRTWEKAIRVEIEGLDTSSRICVTAGGEQRQDSVHCGLTLLSPGVEIVLVHDAARPDVTPRLINRVIEGTRRAKACIPALPLSETVKVVENEQVVTTLDRQKLRLAQTPQGFVAGLLREAFDEAFREGFQGTDEAMLVERLGRPVLVVPGDRRNIKITWTEDLF